MIEVELPDGSIAEFPDGTSNDAIKAAMQNRFGAPQQSRGFWGTVKDNFIGDDDPTTQNTGEKVGSFINRAIETGTFGLLGDEASGALAGMIPGGQTAEEARDFQRQQQALFQRENPEAAVAADIVGAVGGALAPGGAIGTLGRGAGLGARAAASSAAGAGMGGLYGFMEGAGTEARMQGAIEGAKFGGMAGAAAPMLGAGVQRVMDGRAASKAIKQATRNAPTTEALRAQGNAAYQAIDEAGVQIKPQAFDDMRQSIMDGLRNRTGFDELPGPGSLTPNSARTMQIMGDASGRMAAEPTAALPFRSLDQMRRQAGAAAANVSNKSDQRAGMEIIGGMDDFIGRLGADDVVAGDVKTLQEAIPKAREIWSRMSKSQVIDDAIENSGNYLSGGSSGMRNQFARILRNPKLSRSFNDAEKAAMRRVVDGSFPEKLVNLLGGGIGQIAQIGAGIGTGGAVGGALGVGTGALARRASEALAARNAETARALVANGGLTQLPVASDTTRRAIEGMFRRTGAAGSQ